MWEWRRLTPAQLGEIRIANLKLGEGDAPFRASLATVARELRRAGLHFPIAYVFSTEWYVLQGSHTVAVPFYLAHAELRRMARAELGYVEGLRAPERTKIWRHELGHVLANALRVTTRPDFSRLFGKGRPYPRTYLPLSHSHQYVRNLPDSYAQSHPDEDFAETFAVWLDPRSDWRKRYLGTPALVKLEWVDALLAKLSAPERSRRRTRSPELGDRTLRVKDFFARERARRAKSLTPALQRGLPRLLGAPHVRAQLARESGCYLYQIDWLIRGIAPERHPMTLTERRRLTRRVAREAARYFETGRSPLLL